MSRLVWTGETSFLKNPMSYVIPECFQKNFGEVSLALKQFFTTSRLERMQQVAAQRSRQVLIIFENTHHAHNISAVLRTVEAFGFLDIFFLYSQPEIRFRLADNIDRGTSQWLMPRRLSSTEKCISLLKSQGYRIGLVSLPDFSRSSALHCKHIPSFSTSHFSSESFSLTVGDAPLALVFGNELHGISASWHPAADLYISVQMQGFVESLNVSVCAGIILHELRRRLENLSSFLNPRQAEENALLVEHWMAKTCSHAPEFISSRRPELSEWFEFVRAGRFFDPSFETVSP